MKHAQSIHPLAINRMSVSSLFATQLKHLLVHRPHEIALLDVGEEGEYGEGHLLRANHAPFSVLESVVATLVPRPDCLIVLIDHGEDIARQSAKRLERLGYTNLAILEGGTSAWQQAGFELFKGIFVPSKAYGEWLSHGLSTPEITPDELHRLTTSDTGSNDVVILDPRTVAEHAARHVPGAIACPGGELALRVDDLAAHPDTTVVVACGGRTRGLVGAQTLIDAGIPNPVMALADGNHGWQLAGLALEEGLHKTFGVTSELALQQARTRARQLREHYSIHAIDDRTLSQWLGDRTRTTYIFDIRTPEEFGTSHLPGATNAPGGQLLQATDRWIAVLGARIVLVDDDGVRATSVAVHLWRMGWDVHVIEHGTHPASEARGDSIHASLASGSKAADAAARVETPRAAIASKVPEISPRQAWQTLGANSSHPPECIALDVSPSERFLESSACGPNWTAHWANRARLTPWLERAAQGQAFVIFSPDGLVTAQLVASDLHDHAPDSPVAVVQGGLEAWQAEGYSVQSHAPSELARSERIDTLFWARDRRHGDTAAMRQYLDWEHQLLEQVLRDEPEFPSPAAHVSPLAAPYPTKK